MANLHLVTGYAGGAHITAADHGSFNAAVMGEGNYVLSRGRKFEVQYISKNLVRVYDGDLLMQGRHVRLQEKTYIDLTIDNGTQGMQRNDLIVARYTKDSTTGVEECNLVVVKGTPVVSNPVDPECITGDLLTNGDAQTDFPLWRIPLNNLDVGDFEQLFNVVGQYGELDPDGSLVAAGGVIAWIYDTFGNADKEEF